MRYIIAALLLLTLGSTTIHSQTIDTIILKKDTLLFDASDIDTTRIFTPYKNNDSTLALYYAPKWHDFVTNMPGDFVQSGKMLFSKKSIVPVSIVVGTTALLYAFDKPLIDGVQSLSRKMNLSPESRFESFIKIGDVDIMQVPGNANTAMYFIGEGWTSILLVGGIGLKGIITNNKKEIQLLSQFAEGYIEMGIVCQIFKRSFGRENPIVATTDRGKFRPFPSFSDYQNHMPTYDAMPSGHMATMAFTVTLLSEHYPDKKWIRPLGYSLMTICAFSMMNNGVHWSSDYPLGFGIGYLYAKVVANRGRVLKNVIKPNSLLSQIKLRPIMFYNGATGLKLSLNL